MAYTPELSYRSSCTLRRIAWALKIPMTQTMDRVFDHLTDTLDANKVCERCKDRSRCEDCGFNRL